MTGCVNIQKDYVAADRATYDGLRPFVLRGIAATTSRTEADAGKLLLRSWEERLDAASD